MHLMPQLVSLTDAVGHLSREMRVSSADIGKLVQNVGGLAKVYGLRNIRRRLWARL